ncbi:alpha/beta hydrolase [Anthocerotibacter panamensis]|uniref:alpha/beta hydrolase n=1 Tax=Anthocerotibacter panamensis TaxID=2857077 RepID=UPI001C406269|nr:alpha/beta hydrolase [Anthocerotibacter panamensis]
MGWLKAVYSLLVLLLAGSGLFLSAWIVVPAPVFGLLILSVGAPEVSPWLVLLNGCAVLLALNQRGVVRRIALGGGLLGLGLSALPLAQWPATQARLEQAMVSTLGPEYLSGVPASVQAGMRPEPFALAAVFQGLPQDRVRLNAGIPFAQVAGVTLQMNVYQPPAPGRYPALVVVYGGAWQHGSPSQDEPFSRYMAARGYVVFAIDYRHAPEHPYPAQIEDVRTALAFIQANAQRYEADPARLALLGRSAGAHLALLAAYEPGAPPIRAVVDYYGPVDLEQGYYDLPTPDPIDTRQVLEAFLGGPPSTRLGAYRAASPSTYVTRPLPPTLLVYGGRDHLVEQRFGYALWKRLQATGTTAVWLDIPWADHSFDSLFTGLSNQLALYHTERFLAWALYREHPHPSN